MLDFWSFLVVASTVQMRSWGLLVQCRYICRKQDLFTFLWCFFCEERKAYLCFTLCSLLLLLTVCQFWHSLRGFPLHQTCMVRRCGRLTEQFLKLRGKGKATGDSSLVMRCWAGLSLTGRVQGALLMVEAHLMCLMKRCFSARLLFCWWDAPHR